MYWAVLTTQPRSEQRALDHLARQGYGCYAPQHQLTAVLRGRKRTTLKFLFPRYLFVQVADSWYPLLTTYGASRLLMNGEVPAQLPAAWVAMMKAREEDGVVVLNQRRFEIGQRVQITGGVFQGQFGLYQGQSSRQREVVLLTALGKVELASGDL